MKNIAIVILMALFSCGTVEVSPSSTIDGVVSIGPLCGNIPALPDGSSVKNCGLSDAGLDAIYADYTVMLKSSTNTVISQKKLDHTGVFSFNVTEGTYILAVDTKVVGAIQNTKKEQLERTLTLQKDQKQSITITINTGIK